MTAIYLTAGVIAFAMAWAIGAQDVSNALGTSVGAKAVTVRQAIYIAGVCEFLGSLAGGEVAGMISGGILSVDRFIELGDEGVELYSIVMMSTMAGAFIWLAVATYLELPVSTTHSLVGALVGVGTVTLGPSAINFTVITAIVTSWATSPLLGGAISFIVFSVIHTQILLRENPRQAVVRVLPHFYGFTGGTSVAFIARVGPKVLRLSIGKSFFAFLLAYVLTFAVAFHMKVGSGRDSGATHQNKHKHKHKNPSNSVKPNSNTTTKANQGNGATSSKLAVTAAAATAAAAAAAAAAEKDLEDGTVSVEEEALDNDSNSKKSESKPRDDIESAFGPLMVVTACVVSIAHGSNDVSNAVGPFTAIAHIHSTGQIPRGGAAPVWVLICGGIGIVAGLGTYGHKVMATIGEKIAKLTFTRGFAAQIGTALTVLCATQLGLSVSTTHCLIGAITGVTLVEGTNGINKKTIQKIIMSWVITLPASAILAIACYTPVSVLFGGSSSSDQVSFQNTTTIR